MKITHPHPIHIKQNFKMVVILFKIYLFKKIFIHFEIEFTFSTFQIIISPQRLSRYTNQPLYEISRDHHITLLFN